MRGPERRPTPHRQSYLINQSLKKRAASRVPPVGEFGRITRRIFIKFSLLNVDTDGVYVNQSKTGVFDGPNYAGRIWFINASLVARTYNAYLRRLLRLRRSTLQAGIRN